MHDRSIEWSWQSNNNNILYKLLNNGHTKRKLCILCGIRDNDKRILQIGQHHCPVTLLQLIKLNTFHQPASLALGKTSRIFGKIFELMAQKFQITMTLSTTYFQQHCRLHRLKDDLFHSIHHAVRFLSCLINCNNRT